MRPQVHPMELKLDLSLRVNGNIHEPRPRVDSADRRPISRAHLTAANSFITKGDIDEFSIWNRSLSPEVMLSLCELTRAWRFLCTSSPYRPIPYLHAPAQPADASLNPGKIGS